MLGASLAPSGPGRLYGFVEGLSLCAGSLALDVGCGEGAHTIELARRFGLRVRGFDPVARRLRLADAALADSARALPGLADAVSFESAYAHELPVDAATADLVWCRDVLEHVPHLHAAYAEFARVVKPAGRILTYQVFGTDTAAAIAAAGLRVEHSVELGAGLSGRIQVLAR